MGKNAQNRKAKNGKNQKVVVEGVWLDYAAETLTEISMALMGSTNHTWKFRGVRGTVGSFHIGYNPEGAHFKADIDVRSESIHDDVEAAAENVTRNIATALFNKYKIDFAGAVVNTAYAFKMFFSALQDIPSLETTGMIHPVKWDSLLGHFTNERFQYTSAFEEAELIARGFTLPCGGRLECKVSGSNTQVDTSCELPEQVVEAVENWARMLMMTYQNDRSRDAYLDSSTEMRCLLATNFARLHLFYSLAEHAPETCGSHEPVHPSLVFAGI